MITMTTFQFAAALSATAFVSALFGGAIVGITLFRSVGVALKGAK